MHEVSLTAVPVTSQPVNTNVRGATPLKRRRGKCMSRRSGQTGHEEKSGKWYVVRFWMDVPGQEDRKLVRARICPISGPGALSATERLRKRKEIITASGADSVEHFEKVQARNYGLTFRGQADEWLRYMQTRKRKPVAPSTIETWRSCLNKWLNPYLGDMPLSTVDNDSIRELVSRMTDAGLSPKSINNYVQVVKAVVGSAKDRKTRKQLFPVAWDYEYLDMPMVKKSEQRRPTFTSETVTGIVAASKPKNQMLCVLCASTGLRIGEALGIDIRKHISPDCSTILVREKAWKGQIQSFLKTDNGAREVDLHPSVAAMLRTFIGNRTSGLLFCTRNGKPLSLSNILRRSLHPILEKLGQPKAGSHAFRRFRITWLRKNGAPRDLENFWTGHAPETVGDTYSRLRDDVEFRKRVTETVGLGFEIPACGCPIVPNVPKIAVGDVREVAVSC